MKNREYQKMIQIRAKESGFVFKNYSKIDILHVDARLGNPWTMEHDFIFTYDGHRYGQTSRVTGYHSAALKFRTCFIA